MVGFFSSAILAEVAPGLASYIANSTNSFQLILSPFLSGNDQAAIVQGVQSAEEGSAKALLRVMVTADALATHTLKCFAYLLSVGRIEIKIAVMERGLFHPKVWLFQTPRGELVAHGSSNLTEAGVRTNFEQITISKSWMDPTQRYSADKLKTNEFDCQKLLIADEAHNLGRENFISDPPESVRQPLWMDQGQVLAVEGRQ